MRIAVLVSALAVGGAERNAVNYAIGLRRRGHSVTVIAGDGPLRADLDGSGVDYVPAGAHLRQPIGVLGLARTLVRLDQAQHFQIAQCFMASSATAARLARIMGAGFAIVTAPPGVTEDPAEPRWIAALRLRALLMSSDVALSTSAPFRRVMVEHGMPAARIIDVEFNSIPLWRYDTTPEAAMAVRSELGLDPGEPVVLCLARLHPLKRLNLVLEAAPLVLARFPHARFLFVGDGPERERLRGLASRLGVDHRVRFAGVRTDVGAVLRASTLVLQTTYGYGGPGLATLEAFAAGRPVIAFDTADRKLAIGNSGGTVFVTDADVSALAAAIVELIGDPAAAGRMGASGRAWLEAHFDLDRVIARLEEIYRELLATHLVG